MMSIFSRIKRERMAAALLGIAVLPAHAHGQGLHIVLNDVTQGGMSAAQRAAFTTGAHYWESILADPVTVYLTVGFQDLGRGVVGQTYSNYMASTYSSVRQQLVHDATSAVDASAISQLQAGPYLTFEESLNGGGTRHDADTNECPATGPDVPCNFNNANLLITTANAKALGLDPGTNIGNPDAEIYFGTSLFSPFDFDRADGTSAGAVDFVTVVEHEIGHALGFGSGVAVMDSCNRHRCGFGAYPGPYDTDVYVGEQWAFYNTLDLFRYSAPGLLDWRVGEPAYFSVDGGVTAIAGFSTGTSRGSWSPDHFDTTVQRLMRPVIHAGESYDATAADLAAFDAIGWDLVTTAPEPSTVSLMLSGLLLIATLRSRTRGQR